MAEKGSNQKKYRHNFCRKFKWKTSPDATDIWREKIKVYLYLNFPFHFPCLLILSTRAKLQGPQIVSKK